MGAYIIEVLHSTDTTTIIINGYNNIFSYKLEKSLLGNNNILHLVCSILFAILKLTSYKAIPYITYSSTML